MRKIILFIILIVLLVVIVQAINYLKQETEEVGEEAISEEILLEETEAQNGVVKEEQETTVSWEEKKQMYAAAREYIAKYSAEGMEVDLEIVRRRGGWIMLNADPLNIETDPAGVIMEKVGDRWVTRAMGTIFTEWVKKVPQLFE